jgi:hypothetical protein
MLKYEFSVVSSTNFAEEIQSMKKMFTHLQQILLWDPSYLAL